MVRESKRSGVQAERHTFLVREPKRSGVQAGRLTFLVREPKRSGVQAERPTFSVREPNGERAPKSSYLFGWKKSNHKGNYFLGLAPHSVLEPERSGVQAERLTFLVPNQNGLPARSLVRNTQMLG